ncbi:hypothetical protein A6P39_000835 [Streptomyces sp. FXJ1.172]|uniref:hypothetical protein n=1 Tax=Streptomyces sp. FXJ1.172 TaxID=710705 RepID=UPI0007D0064A|nr:hypothetical protein [Streptomyces sp. FXJ1.172]WEO92782.1 hypothetical protein A6P39_000835 [Streptomyces sp. FXJ1.172]
MVIVACMLLPMVALVLYGMDRVEDWLTHASQPSRRARRRHLLLIQGGRQVPLMRRQTDQKRSDAA